MAFCTVTPADALTPGADAVIVTGAGDAMFVSISLVPEKVAQPLASVAYDLFGPLARLAFAAPAVMLKVTVEVMLVINLFVAS